MRHWWCEMSRSFYVDSLIVKRSTPPVTETVCISHPSSLHTPVPLGHRPHPEGHIPPGHHALPCYPRHPSDILNLCCPLCVQTPAPGIPESSSSMPVINSNFSFSSSAGHISRLNSGFSIPRPQLSTPKKEQISPQGRKSPLLTEQKKSKSTSIGKCK